MNIRRSTFCLCLLVAFSFFFFASDVFAAPKKPRIKLKAKAAMLVNDSTGKILYAKNPDRPMQPASLTKILSLYLVHEAISQGRIHTEDRVRISMNAQITGGSSMYLVDETEVGLDDLIKGIAVVSANDASVAVAEHIGGSIDGFVGMMNSKAKALGMKRSHFVNPNGLPAKGQVSTARDILKLSRAYIRDFPEALQIHSMQEYTFANITQRNSNTLLRQREDVDGLKTGFVRAAGFHLVATAKRGNTRLIAVVMGEKNPKVRANDATKLLEQGFRMAAMKGKAAVSLRSRL
ncbi:MAG TPA: D-alanyl-D-alanine carboxypeptidase family protein [Syntrophales bacterium]|nr:D-alanyl-D-alanine carboxypeptidase family protein [Syntrophales bacterium]